jgi:hypothetical protein
MHQPGDQEHGRKMGHPHFSKETKAWQGVEHSQTTESSERSETPPRHADDMSFDQAVEEQENPSDDSDDDF